MAILMNSFKFTMEILCLKGTDKRMYELVAPLIMNPAIIRQNNNYPFKTTDHYLWYIAKEWVETVAVEGTRLPLYKNASRS